MIDWTKTMDQSFEYYEMDPLSWHDIRMIDNIKSCSINRDSTSNTLGSASFDITNTIGETYIRVYLKVTQNDIEDKIPLGVYLVQTPNSTFDGKTRNVSMDAYTPLLELSEKPIPLGYSVLKDDNILNQAYLIIRDNCRAPVVKTDVDKTLEFDFVANTSDTYLVFVKDFLKVAEYELSLDQNGTILFEPYRKIDELQPVWTFSDDNSSILLPEVSLKHDLYGIPNVVEVITTINNEIYVSRVENNDITSPTSIQNRGREIIHRDNSPKFSGIPSREMIDEYAEKLLSTLSSVEYEISYSHGYCPVRVNDCVRLNYEKAGLIDIKAKVISQSIKCDTGCMVSERAVFTKKLYK